MKETRRNRAINELLAVIRELNIEEIQTLTKCINRTPSHFTIIDLVTYSGSPDELKRTC